MMKNAYKDEFTRRTLQHAMDASAARNKVVRERAALSRQDMEKRARRDADAVECVRALIDHACVAGSGLASIGLFPTTPTYKESKWLIDVILSVCAAAAPVREEARKTMAGKASSGSFASRAMGVGAFVADKADTATAVLSIGASQIVQTTVQNILIANPAIGLGPVITAKAHVIVTHVLANVGNHISVILLGKTSALAIACMALSALSVKDRLEQMQCLTECYEGYCTCCDATEKISQGWMAGITGRGLDAVPFVGAAHVVASISMKVAHRIHKKVNPAAHHAPFYVATELWQAARRPTESGCKPCIGGGRNGFGTLPRQPNDRCPLALLTLASLFGGGDPAKGVRKAAAAAIATQHDAVKKIKGLIAASSDSAFDRTMTRLENTAATRLNWGVRPN